jgi:hypothetical protein
LLTLKRSSRIYFINGLEACHRDLRLLIGVHR